MRATKFGPILCGVLLAAGPVWGNTLRQLDEAVVHIVREVSPSVLTVVAEAAREGGLQRRIGSAVVLDDSGHVITTASVVDGSERITLKTCDGRAFAASVIGSDMLSNVAVLRTANPHQALVPARPGCHTELAVGSWVATIANTYGVPSGVTVGTVVDPGPRPCGLSEVGEIRMNLRATPGASGGAVINCEGEIVGILTAAMGPGSTELAVDADYVGGRLYGYVPEQDLGMSLAVPIESACRIAERLKHRGEVQRGWLGVRIDEQSDGSQERGVMLAGVLPGSPAERAELHRGDLIVSLDGEQTGSCAELKRLVAEKTQGTIVTMGIVRGTETVEKTVELGSVPEELLRSLRAAGASDPHDPVGQVRWWWHRPRDGEELRRQIEDLEETLEALKAEVARLEAKR